MYSKRIENTVLEKRNFGKTKLCGLNLPIYNINVLRQLSAYLCDKLNINTLKNLFVYATCKRS